MNNGKIFLLTFICAASTLLSAQTEKKDSLKNKKELKSLFQNNVKYYEAYNIPSSVQVITREDIDRLPFALTISDVLQNALNVDVRKQNPLGSVSEVGIRGSNAASIQLLLNGTKINSYLSSSLSLITLPVPLIMVERIEIYRGGNAKLFGEGAEGGAINIITRQDVEKSGIALGLSAGSRNSVNPEALVAYKNKWNTTMISYQGNLEKENKNYGFVYNNVFLDSHFRPFSWFEPVLTAGYNNDYMFLPPSDKNISDKNQNVMLDNYFIKSSFNFYISKTYKMWLNFKYLHNFDQIDEYGYRDTPIDDPFAILKLSQVKYNRQDRYDLRLGGRLETKFYQLFYEINYNNTNLYSSYIQADILKNWYKIPGRDFAYYKFTNKREEWAIRLQNIFNFYGIQASLGGIVTGSKAYGDKVLFGGGGELSYEIVKGLRIFANGDYSFRAPNFEELFVNTDSLRGRSGLEMENQITTELGIKYRNKWSSAGLVGNIEWTNQYIALTYSTTYQRYLYNNLSEQVRFGGVEFFYDINLDKLTETKVPITKLRLQYSFNSSNLKAQNVIRTYNYLINKFNVQFTSKIYSNLYIDIDYNLENRNGIYSPFPGDNYKKYPLLNLLDARIAWREKVWEIYLQGSNLIDQRYYDFSFNSLPGITALMGAKINLQF